MDMPIIEVSGDVHALIEELNDALPAFAGVTEEMHASAADPCAPTTFLWHPSTPMVRLRS